MALRPRVKSDGQPVRPLAKMGNSFEAVTKYRVLADNGSAALVQCTPETGLYHGFLKAKLWQDCTVSSFACLDG